MTDKNLLILDLDEMLVYGTKLTLERGPDLFASGYHIYFRPGLNRFIRQRHSVARRCR